MKKISTQELEHTSLICLTFQLRIVFKIIQKAALLIFPVGESFYIVACEVYYNTEFIYVKDNSMSCLHNLNRIPREKIRAEFGEKVVQMNSIHYADTTPNGGQIIADLSDYEGEFAMRICRL